MADYVTCPFCGEGDFDLIGLKAHFLRGWCDAFNDTEGLSASRARLADLADEAATLATVLIAAPEDRP
jgi:hypothetical protein